MRRRNSILLLGSLWLLSACGGDGRGDLASSDTTAGATAETGDSDDDGAGDDTGIRLDVDGGGLDIPGTGSCHVMPDGNGVGHCEDVAPPDSFDPEVQWEWTPDEDIFSVVIPLVANLTDDDGNGSVDLCDRPDIVIQAFPDFNNPPLPGHLYVLDGETGAVHDRFEREIKSFAGPAIADLDEDGVPEIVTMAFDGHLVAFRPDGSIVWESEHFSDSYHGAAVAVADVDNDGDPELLYDDRLYDHLGNLIHVFNVDNMISNASAIADLDGDGDQELVFGHSAYHHTGEVHYSNEWLAWGQVGIGDFDQDGEPEIVYPNQDGLAMLESDGEAIFSGLNPTGDLIGGLNWPRPPTVHDFDGDGIAEFASSSRSHYAVYEADASLLWTADIIDDSGLAGGTAFDFLGDGKPEAMYADEHNLYVYGDGGEILMQLPRHSRTLREYPVVADVDNDGSAEIAVVSNETTTEETGSPTLQIIRDKDDRWIQARRIWNQHTYHVTNVREDGTIPQFETPSWEQLNTYRVNAQIAKGGGVCKPKPQG
jgi:hypothetical protein